MVPPLACRFIVNDVRREPLGSTGDVTRVGVALPEAVAVLTPEGVETMARRITSAARVRSVSDVPWAIRDAVPIEQGTTAIACHPALPLAKGAR